MSLSALLSWYSSHQTERWIQRLSFCLGRREFCYPYGHKKHCFCLVQMNAHKQGYSMEIESRLESPPPVERRLYSENFHLLQRRNIPFFENEDR